MSTSAEYIPGVAELGRKNQAGGYVGISPGIVCSIDNVTVMEA